MELGKKEPENVALLSLSECLTAATLALRLSPTVTVSMQHSDNSYSKVHGRDHLCVLYFSYPAMETPKKAKTASNAAGFISKNPPVDAGLLGCGLKSSRK
jgi:hypothetical protein